MMRARRGTIIALAALAAMALAAPGLLQPTFAQTKESRARQTAGGTGRRSQFG